MKVENLLNNPRAAPAISITLHCYKEFPQISISIIDRQPRVLRCARLGGAITTNQTRPPFPPAGRHPATLPPAGPGRASGKPEEDVGGLSTKDQKGGIQALRNAWTLYM